MSFVFTTTQVVRREVTFRAPCDGTGHADAKAHVTFEIVPADDDNPRTYDRAFFLEHVKNVEGLVDEKKEPINFTPEFLKAFLSVEWVMAGLVREYLTLTIAAGRGN